MSHRVRGVLSAAVLVLAGMLSATTVAQSPDAPAPTVQSPAARPPAAQASDARVPRDQYDPRTVLLQARSEEQGILEQLTMIDFELESVLRDTLDLRTEVDVLETRRTSHAAAVDEAEDRLARLEGGVRDQIRALYRLYKRGPAQLLFGASDPAELRRRGRYLKHAVTADAGRLQEFQTVRDERKKALKALDADMARLAKLRADLELKETELREQRAVRMDLLQKVRERRDLSLRAAGEMDRARASFDQQLVLQTEPAAPPTDAWAGGMGLSGPAMPTAPSHAGSFRQSYGSLPWPVRGQVVRRFGPSTDPATGLRSRSTGIDVAAEFGEPVRAVYRGVVRMAGRIPGLGQTVALQHGSYTSIYAHLGGVRVQVDDVVNAGQVVGIVGNSGLTAADGHRLTFEVRYNNSPQDPLPWLKK